MLPNQSLPSAILLGLDAQRPAVRIAPLAETERARAENSLPLNEGLAGRLSAALQAVPGVLVEEGHRGKRLMEVVIDGELVRGKDGASFRAWAVGADNKISEHAKLYEAENLQSLVNTAAVWQVASIVVAQKHLADISKKLDVIREILQEVVHFLDDGRRAQVTGTYEYLQQAASAIGKGELSPAIRNELESCDRQLIQIQHHLQQELERRCMQDLEHKEFAGTAEMEKEAVAKYEKLKSLVKDFRLTLKTRVLVWYMISLHPGESALKGAKMEGLMRSIDEVEKQLATIHTSVDRDCDKFTSLWNKGVTLDIRKTNVREAAQALASDLSEAASHANADVTGAHLSLLELDKPTHLFFEVTNGKVGQFSLESRAPK
ncbi:hypothetical protein GTP56_05345 [Duganella sp. FT134W]|uniref:Uncharacterized protein n=1 Tax=Duganella margarita TaxID=2692170 RepID=A0A7X4GXT6_9BURK|nr:hypothetical protein [Duganella margarita]MYM71621.1 hypothetical protein [Duganella margarita]